jgi:hypothetical protein
MNYIKVMFRSHLVLAVGCLGLLWLAQAAEAGSSASVPPVIQDGFTIWAKSGALLAFDAWRKGGFLEDSRKLASQSSYIQRLDQAIGNYKSYDLVEDKGIGPSSQILYFAVNFERGALYARFLVYRTEKGWVVQDMDFSTKPEAVMPWVTFQGVSYTE